MMKRKKTAGRRERLPFSEEKRNEIKYSGREQRPDEEHISAPTRFFSPKKDEENRPARKPFSERPGRDERPARRPYGDRPKRDDSERPARKPYGERAGRDSSERPVRKPYSDRPKRDDSERPARKPYGERAGRDSSERPARKPYSDRPKRDDSERPARKPYGERAGRDSSERPARKPYSDRPKRDDSERPARKTSREAPSGDLIRLNKYISNAGICSRREADVLIQSGIIKVNGVPVTEMGYKVSRNDKVQYGDQTLNSEKLRYVLLNKPKGFITTTEDPENRKTVMALVEKACKERIYPVGRLDRNTTGLLLFTNDGEIAKKLSHPRYGIRKIYHVTLDKNLTKADLNKISEGIEMEDGFLKVDAIEYITDAKDKKEIGIELHSGKNRVVRRLFESLEYKVEKLDRVAFAGLTKKNLPRGEWRFLTPMEENMLKMIH